MQANTIKVTLILILFFSCKSIDKTKSQSPSPQSNDGRCSLLQDVVDINPTLFEPFGDVYKAFMERDSGISIVSRTMGQRSEVCWLYQLKKDTEFQLMKYNEKGLLKDTILTVEPMILENVSGDYAFLCNQNSTDLGTNVYILKKGNLIVSNMWFENG
ncbi:MAG: hypothetical protein AAFV95_27325, partial [Bacteroidota bacterium]